MPVSVDRATTMTIAGEATVVPGAGSIRNLVGLSGDDAVFAVTGDEIKR